MGLLGLGGSTFRLHGPTQKVSPRHCRRGRSSPEASTPPCLLIRPFCITILHHNLSLFIDIFHIMIQYLCYFTLFCMFRNYWGCICRSPESAGKVPVKILEFGSPKNSQKFRNSFLLEKTHRARRLARWEPPGAGAGAHRGPTSDRGWGRSLPPRTPPPAPLWRTTTP